jgi:hypothetical protein
MVRVVTRAVVINSNLSKGIIDLRECIDRLIGGEPPESGKPGPQAVPSGDIGALGQEMDSYATMVARLEYEINRLRAI